MVRAGAHRHDRCATDLLQPGYAIGPGHLRHHHVDQDHANLVMILPEDRERLLDAGGLVDAEPLGTQDVPDQLTDRGIVVHHEHDVPGPRPLLHLQCPPRAHQSSDHRSSPVLVRPAYHPPRLAASRDQFTPARSLRAYARFGRPPNPEACGAISVRVWRLVFARATMRE